MKDLHTKAKMMIPTRRERRGPAKVEDVVPSTVKQTDDGEVCITKVEYRATSAGRQKFGGTVGWDKFPSDDPELVRFLQ